MLIDVVVEVSFVEPIVSVEQFGIKYFLFGILFYLLAEEVFLTEVVMEYFPFEFMQIVLLLQCLYLFFYCTRQFLSLQIHYFLSRFFQLRR